MPNVTCLLFQAGLVLFAHIELKLNRTRRLARFCTVWFFGKEGNFPGECKIEFYEILIVMFVFVSYKLNTQQIVIYLLKIKST